jgi:integrase
MKTKGLASATNRQFVTSRNPGGSSAEGEIGEEKRGRRVGRRAAKSAIAELKLARDDGSANIVPGSGAGTPPEKAKDRLIWDTELPGFGIRVSTAGNQAYVIQYRERGHTRRRVIGKVGDMDPRLARRKARALLSRVQIGGRVVDPFAAAATVPSVRLADFVAQYLATHAHRWAATTLACNRQLVDRYVLPTMGEMQLADITRADMLAWRDATMSKPGVVNRTLPVLSVMMKHAETLGLRPKGSNPCRGLRRREQPGLARYLTGDELARLGRALDAAQQRWPLECAVIRLLLFTGARKSEITTLEWDWIDGRYIHLPRSKTGPKTLYLGKAARDVLASIARDDRSPLVFPATGKRPLVIQSTWWAALLADAGITHCRIHDLRHNYASHAVMLRIGLPTVSKLLGHGLAETTQRYAHLSDEAVASAVRRMSDRLSAATGFGQVAQA